MLVLIGIYYHYIPPGLKLSPKVRGTRTHHSTYHLLVSKVVRLEMMT